MVFSSIEFLWVFLPVVLVAYLVLPPRARNLLLAAVSLAFYAWGARSFLLLFLASIAGNFAFGLWVGRVREDEAARRRVVLVAVAANLLVLFTWKYTAFAAAQLDRILGLAGGGIGVPTIALPIGISFFTFHGISYVVDVARRRSRPLRSPVDFAQYMAFFPQLIAGPIVRFHQIDTQLAEPPLRAKRLDDLADGFPRFVLGLSKKVLVADPAGAVADACFASSGDLTTPAAWLGAVAYTVQLYFDFSGYSDMAIGLARMFGFRFPENFERPYSAVSITDFWRRWHMTLSRFFRDYLYVPLGGNRGTQRQTVRNLAIVFLLTGLWHGAAWTFVLWGAWHGGLVIVERLTGVARMDDDRLHVVRRTLTLVLVIVGWVLFRSGSVDQALEVLRAMFVSFDFGTLPAPVADAARGPAVTALVIGVASFLLPRTWLTGQRVQDLPWTPGRGLVLRVAVLATLPYAAITVAAGSFSPFLYFQF